MQKIKCVVVGDGGVGKTTMLTSYTKNRFPDEHRAAKYGNYCIEYPVDGDYINLALFDIAGFEDLDALRPVTRYPNTDVFIVCFSIASPASLRNVRLKWIPEITMYAPKAAILLVGTKVDLYKNFSYGSFVKESDVRSLAKEINAQGLWECSSLTQKGVREVFDEAVRAALRKQMMDEMRNDEERSIVSCKVNCTIL